MDGRESEVCRKVRQVEMDKGMNLASRVCVDQEETKESWS